MAESIYEEYLVSVPSANASRPLNLDLCKSNPLIMFTPPPNPRAPRSRLSACLSACPGMCCQWPPSSSWSGLRPALAASPRPCRAPAASSPPGWATSEVTVATLANDTSPFWLQPPHPPPPSPDSHPAKLRSQQSWCGAGSLGSSGHRTGASPFSQAPWWEINKERLSDGAFLQGPFQFSLVWPGSDQQDTGPLWPSL